MFLPNLNALFSLNFEVMAGSVVVTLALLLASHTARELRPSMTSHLHTNCLIGARSPFNLDKVAPHATSNLRQ